MGVMTKEYRTHINPVAVKADMTKSTLMLREEVRCYERT